MEESLIQGCPILGQDRAIAQLGTCFETGHMHHAWIFNGPAGVGKFTTAMQLAHCLLDPEATAQQQVSLSAPQGSRVAELIGAGTHPDLHVISKEDARDSSVAALRERKQSNIPIDLLRERIVGGTTGDQKYHEPAVAKSPYLGHGKVFIIREAERLDLEAQNALLKSLEEPPPNTWIILLTTAEHRLVATIKSRCQRLSFRQLQQDQMRIWSSQSALQDCDPAIKEWILEFADGSPGLALKAMQFELHDWLVSLTPCLRDLQAGRYPQGMAKQMAELIEASTKLILKQNSKASSLSANRDGFSMMMRLLGWFCRKQLQRSVSDADVAGMALWSDRIQIASESELQQEANVNLKQLLENLTAQWARQQSQAGGNV